MEIIIISGNRIFVVFYLFFSLQDIREKMREENIYRWKKIENSVKYEGV